MPIAIEPPSDFDFRPLTTADLPMLCAWLHRPHVAEWWHDPPTEGELFDDYLSPTALVGSTRAYIVWRDDQPIGFIQSYVVLGSGDGWWEDETDPGARGTDQFLADASQLGQGIGSAMVRAFVQQLFRDPLVTVVQTDPSPANTRAIRAYARAGFAPVGEVETPDGTALLMRCTRSALDDNPSAPR